MIGNKSVDLTWRKIFIYLYLYDRDGGSRSK